MRKMSPLFRKQSSENDRERAVRNVMKQEEHAEQSRLKEQRTTAYNEELQTRRIDNARFNAARTAERERLGPSGRLSRFGGRALGGFERLATASAKTKAAGKRYGNPRLQQRRYARVPMQPPQTVPTPQPFDNRFSDLFDINQNRGGSLPNNTLPSQLRRSFKRK